MTARRLPLLFRPIPALLVALTLSVFIGFPPSSALSQPPPLRTTVVQDPGPFKDKQALNQATMEVFERLRKNYRIQAFEAQYIYRIIREHLRTGGDRRSPGILVGKAFWNTCRGPCMGAAFDGFMKARALGIDEVEAILLVDTAMAVAFKGLTWPNSEVNLGLAVSKEIDAALARRAVPTPAPPASTHKTPPSP